MDFIVKLPLSHDSASDNPYDSILLIADKLTKFAYPLDSGP